MMNAPATVIAGELSAVLLSVVEHPRVQGLSAVHTITEWMVQGLVRPGGAPVERDREITSDDTHTRTTASQDATHRPPALSDSAVTFRVGQSVPSRCSGTGRPARRLRQRDVAVAVRPRRPDKELEE